MSYSTAWAFARYCTLSIIIAVFAGCSTPKETADNGSSADTTTPSAEKRLVPNSIEEEVPQAYRRAVSNETRTLSGNPGENYWQQYANYDLDVQLDTTAHTLEGSGTITYYNHSPDTLNQLFLELSQNAHKEGIQRKMNAEITGGVTIEKVLFQGDTLDTIQYRGQYGYIVDGTIMVLLPDYRIAPGDSVKINIDWNFKIPRKGASGRMGHNREDLFYIAYWYPQMRVYDDVNGWFTDPFLLNAEFYHGFADYQVDITVPDHWLVAATGELLNGRQVLKKSIYERMQRAYDSDEAVTVVSPSDFGNITRAGDDSTVTWQFKAKNVRDFAFSASSSSVWDAARAPVGDRDGDGEVDSTRINAIYHNTSALWKDAVSHSRHSITFLSSYTGVEYPWPHMTAVEGANIIGNTGGMEHPMMTLIGSYNNRSAGSLYAVIAHELAHMWVPMQVSTNERRYSWIDEGTTSFNENQAEGDRYPDKKNFEVEDFRSYLRIAGTAYEGPIMRWSDFHYYSLAFGVASYSKPASLLTSLRGLLGEKTFKKALQTFTERWQYKHPYPWDFFNTFEEVSGRDLDWFWRSWYYETWTLDHSVAEVTPSDEGTRIVIEDRGQAPMPAHVEITLAGGETLRRTVGVDTWLNGSTKAVITLDRPDPVTKVVIDPDYLFPDADRSNNSWEKQ